MGERNKTSSVEVRVDSEGGIIGFRGNLLTDFVIKGVPQCQLKRKAVSVSDAGTAFVLMVYRLRLPVSRGHEFYTLLLIKNKN